MILVLSIIGHEVVRLPVAHCELNFIEMAWSQVKGHVKRNNKRYINFVIDSSDSEDGDGCDGGINDSSSTSNSESESSAEPPSSDVRLF